MKFSDLSIGERLSIKVMLSDETFSSVTYTSIIEDFPEPNHMCFSSPTATDMQRWIGRKLQIVVARDNAAYTCVVEVLDQKKENRVYLLFVKALSDFKKVQRREFYRFKIELNVKIADIGLVSTVDISGNGLALKTKDPLEDNVTITGMLDLYKEHIKFEGTVINSELVTHPDEPNYHIVRLKYTDIDPRDQERIVKFINDQQTAMRRKRLILKGE